MLPEAVAEAFYQALQNHESDEEWILKKDEAWQYNKWFTPEAIDQSLNQWRHSLQPDFVKQWSEPYGIESENKQSKVGIIMAGNIPLVGMHDLLCALICGFPVVVKTSSEDEKLPAFWVKKAIEFLPELETRIQFSENFKNVDAAIATGSNNSARYFEYYFKTKPHLLRKNRNSVAVLSGTETEDELVALGHDVFDYFGLGCRNVTHLLLPENYAFKPLFDAWMAFAGVADHNKYVNNYHYHKALLLMNLDPHLDNGFMLLKEKPEIYSPVGMLNYSFYKNLDEVVEFLGHKSDQIQCVVSHISDLGVLPLGSAQNTMLWDYADGKDTIQFLQSLN